MARVRKVSTEEDFKALRRKFVRRLRDVANKLRNQTEPPPMAENPVLFASLLDEARYLGTAATPHVNQMPLLASLTGKKKPSLMQVQSEAADMIGTLLKWKTDISDIQTIMWGAEKAMRSAEEVSELRHIAQSTLNEFAAAYPGAEIDALEDLLPRFRDEWDEDD